MNGNLTDITIVLDKSGSMGSVKEDVVGGFNTFVEGQKNAPGEATLTLVQFDTQYVSVYSAINIYDTPSLDFRPLGCTALLDAMGKAIVDTGERLNNMKEEDRPGKVVFVIITDGLENASKEYTKQQIKDMIKHQQEKYNWKFVFLAANQDAIFEAESMGIDAGNAINYSHTSLGYKSIFATISDNLTGFRCEEHNDLAFSDEDRARAIDPEDKRC